jgi:hypothetical protein
MSFRHLNLLFPLALSSFLTSTLALDFFPLPYALCHFASLTRTKEICYRSKYEQPPSGDFFICPSWLFPDRSPLTCNGGSPPENSENPRRRRLGHRANNSKDSSRFKVRSSKSDGRRKPGVCGKQLRLDYSNT